MKINTVAILGAGAVGCYFIWGLEDKLGENLWVIADGKRKERLEKEGVMINGERHMVHVKTPKEARGVDLLLISTKYGALYDILDDVAEIADEHTIVSSLLNGVDSEEILETRIPHEQMIYSLMKISSERRNGQVFFNGPKTLGIYFGEPDTPEVTERMQAIIDLFEGTPLHYYAVPDIRKKIWIKFALNVSKNQPQAVIGCGVGGYVDSKHVEWILDRLLDEVIAIAAAKGIDMEKEARGVEGKGTPTSKKARFSTLQDLDAKRHTEVDMFAGTVVRMGKELGIPTPFNEMIFHEIKALEEKNDGLFDY